LICARQTVGVYLTVIYFLITLGEYVSILFSAYGICQQTGLLLICLVVAVLGQIPSWAELSWLALAFFFVTAASIGVLVFESLV
jgi:hypothetical protein